MAGSEVGRGAQPYRGMASMERARGAQSRFMPDVQAIRRRSRARGAAGSSRREVDWNRTLAAMADEERQQRLDAIGSLLGSVGVAVARAREPAVRGRRIMRGVLGGHEPLTSRQRAYLESRGTPMEDWEGPTGAGREAFARSVYEQREPMPVDWREIRSFEDARRVNRMPDTEPSPPATGRRGQFAREAPETPGLAGVSPQAVEDYEEMLREAGLLRRVREW